MQTTGSQASSSENTKTLASVAIAEGRTINDSVHHSSAVDTERTTPTTMAGTQCPEEPCHIIFHEVYHKEAEDTAVVKQAIANDKWMPVQ